MTNTTAPRQPFPDTDHMIGQWASLERIGSKRGQGNVPGVIVSVDPAPAGARMTTATVRADEDGQEYVVRVPREIAQQR